MTTNKISPTQVKHIAKLAQIPVTDSETVEFSQAFEETLGVIQNLKSLNVDNIETTHQVTGLENILREDKIDAKRMFTQQEALANASQTHNGFFVVPRLIDNEN